VRDAWTIDQHALGRAEPKPAACETTSAAKVAPVDKVALDNGDIKTAVKLWFENKDEAKKKYGDIKDWDTSGVTDIGERLPRLPCK